LWTDGSRSDDGRFVAAAVCNQSDDWRAFRCHPRTSCTQVYDAELRGIPLTLWESVKKWD
jgi:hypothetical protein